MSDLTVVLFVGLLVWIGYEMRATGANPSAAEDAVTSVKSGSRNARRKACRIEGSSSINSSVGTAPLQIRADR